MAKQATHIPEHFDTAFLNWFGERTETTWAALPQRTPEDLLARFLRGETTIDEVDAKYWQFGTQWLRDLTDDNLAEIERRTQFTFPPDQRLVLRHLHTVDRPMLVTDLVDELPEEDAENVLATAPFEEDGEEAGILAVLQVSPPLYNWRTDTEAIEQASSHLQEDMLLDLEDLGTWDEHWGTMPETSEERHDRRQELLESAPRIVPLSRHHYILADSGHSGHSGSPVLSVWLSEITVYAADLRDYLLHEFKEQLGLTAQERRHIERMVHARVENQHSDYSAIPFWGAFL